MRGAMCPAHNFFCRAHTGTHERQSGEAEKTRKNYENAKYFALSFSAAFVVFSLMALGAGLVPLQGAGAQAQTPQSGVAVDEVYLPRAEDNLSVLFTAQAKDGARRFALVKLDVEAGGIAVRWLPPEMLLTFGGKRTELGELYGRDGPRAVKTALTQELGEPVDRWMAFSEKALIAAADALGTVEYSPPGRGQYRDSGTPQTPQNVARELRRLDGAAFAALLFAPDVDMRQAKVAIEAYLGAALQNMLTDKADDCFSEIVDLADTDISFLDYDNRREALCFLARLGG